MGIGKRLQQRRKELALSVKEVAQAVGIAPTTLYDLERGEQTSTTKLHRLCKVLGLHEDWVEFNRGPRLLSEPAPVVEPVKSSASEMDLAVLNALNSLTADVRLPIKMMILALAAAVNPSYHAWEIKLGRLAVKRDLVAAKRTRHSKPET